MWKTPCITEESLKTVLGGYNGNDLFAAALQGTKNGTDLLRLLGRYIEFNSVFGGGVANLAGEIAVRKHLFRDPRENIRTIGDRSALIAAKVFAAAIAEFGGESGGAAGDTAEYTHRALAQATLEGIAQFYGFTPEAIDELLVPTPELTGAIVSVEAGYLLNREIEDADLFRGIGFHMGSEFLADQEFNILDKFLQARYPALVEFLRKTKVAIDGVPHPAYVWVEIHTTVEEDHFGFAVQGANLGLRYYKGNSSEGELIGAVEEGFVNFANVQTAFMAYLGSQNS